jgi:hypothetical protein
LPPRTTKRQLLDLLSTTGGLRREDVGRIDLRGTLAAIEVPPAWEARLVKNLDGAELKGQRLRAWSADSAVSPSAPGDHFQRLARLLELESAAEARQVLETVRRLSATEAQHNGDCLVGLVVKEESAGLGGRCIVTLAPRNRSLALPWTRLQPGAAVMLSAEDGLDGEGRRGVVCEREEGASCLWRATSSLDRSSLYVAECSASSSGLSRATCKAGPPTSADCPAGSACETEGSRARRGSSILPAGSILYAP